MGVAGQDEGVRRIISCNFWKIRALEEARGHLSMATGLAARFVALRRGALNVGLTAHGPWYSGVNMSFLVEVFEER